MFTVGLLYALLAVALATAPSRAYQAVLQEDELVVLLDETPLSFVKNDIDLLPNVPLILVDVGIEPPDAPPAALTEVLPPPKKYKTQRAAIVAEASRGLNLTALLYEFADIERALLDKLTVIEASTAERNAEWQAQLNSTKNELQNVGETITVIRYLLQEEDHYVSQKLQLEGRKERLDKLQKTLSLLRKDNEARAEEYLSYNEAALIAADKVVRAFAVVKTKLDLEYAEWERAQRSSHQAYLAGLGSQLSSVSNTVARQRELLQEDYRIAGAAKRIIDDMSAPVVNPAIGAEDADMVELSGAKLRRAVEKARVGWTDARARDFEAISAYDEEIQRLREEIAEKRAFIGDTHKLLQAERLRLEKMGMQLSDAGSNSSSVSQLTAEADSLLSKMLRSQLQSLLEIVRGMLDTHHKQQLDARSRATAPHNSSNANSSTENTLLAWGSSPSQVASELTQIDDQRKKLEAARKVLEDELARRATRVLKGQWQSSGNGLAIPPGGSALLAAVKAAGGVGLGATVTELIYSSSIQRLLLAAGVDKGAAITNGIGGVNLGTGGLHGLGGCEYCAAQRQIGRIADEVMRLRAELQSCLTKPAEYQPDCRPRLEFQIDKLTLEMQRRQASITAEDVEMERVVEQLQIQLSVCEFNNTAKPSTCTDADIRAVRTFLKLLKGEVDTRTRLTAQALIRKQYACLWQYRNNTMAEVVASIMTEGESPIDNAFATSLAFLEVQSQSTVHSDAAEQGGRPSRRTRMLNMCVAMKDASFASADGLRSCLCAELEAVDGIRKKALSEAETRSEALSKAGKAAAAAAAKQEQDKLAAEQTALAAAKEKLFNELKNRPEFAQMVQDAMRKAKQTT